LKNGNYGLDSSSWKNKDGRESGREKERGRISMMIDLEIFRLIEVILKSITAFGKNLCTALNGVVKVVYPPRSSVFVYPPTTTRGMKSSLMLDNAL
jgi:hypothetical protein